MASAGVLALTLGIGVFPWVSFSLAILFTAYGYIRKVAPVGAMPGLFIEVSLLAPFALLYLFWITKSGDGAFLGGDGALDGLLVLAGPVTVIPLVMFAVAAVVSATAPLFVLVMFFQRQIVSGLTAGAVKG